MKLGLMPKFDVGLSVRKAGQPSMVINYAIFAGFMKGYFIWELGFGVQWWRIGVNRALQLTNSPRITGNDW